MTDTRAVQRSPASENRDGYVTVSVTLAGHSYEFNFYKGFVRRLTGGDIEEGGGDVIEIENSASTCPPTCDPD